MNCLFHTLAGSMLCLGSLAYAQSHEVPQFQPRNQVWKL